MQTAAVTWFSLHCHINSVKKGLCFKVSAAWKRHTTNESQVCAAVTHLLRFTSCVDTDLHHHVYQSTFHSQKHVFVEITINNTPFIQRIEFQKHHGINFLIIFLNGVAEASFDYSLGLGVLLITRPPLASHGRRGFPHLLPDVTAGQPDCRFCCSWYAGMLLHSSGIVLAVHKCNRGSAGLIDHRMSHFTGTTWTIVQHLVYAQALDYRIWRVPQPPSRREIKNPFFPFDFIFKCKIFYFEKMTGFLKIECTCPSWHISFLTYVRICWWVSISSWFWCYLSPQRTHFRGKDVCGRR